MRVRESRQNAAFGWATACWWGRLGVTVLSAALAFGLLGPLSARAAFTQPFVRTIGATPSVSKGCAFAFCPEGVAVDSAGELWVGNGQEALSEFEREFEPFVEPVGAFLATFPLEQFESPSTAPHPTAPESLAIERTERLAGHYFYFTAHNDPSGANRPFVEVFDKAGHWSGTRWEVGSGAHIAIDNSLALSAGAVYVASGTDKTISKFNGAGVPVSFTCSAPYIKGNEITGFGFLSPLGIAVDSGGSIYVAVHEYTSNHDAVVKFNSCGEFLQVFSGEGTPGLGGSHEEGGWGGRVVGVAVDPVSGLLAVSVTPPGNAARNEGAVDEFDSFGHFLNQITETSAGARLRSASEMTFDSHGDLYVVDRSERAVDVYGPGRFVPSFRLAEASKRTPESAVLNGWVNPESSLDPQNTGLSDCHFEYVTEDAFKKEGFSKPSPPVECEPEAGEIGAGDSYTAVHAPVTGLVSGTTYYYRVAATIAGTLGGIAAYSGQVAFTAPHAPRVDSTSATNPSSTFADLRAQIDPLGADTSYHFEYSSDGVSWVKAPVPDADIGSGGPTGSADASVLQQIGGLTPGTTYRFRVIAKNEFGTTEAEGPEDLNHKFKFTTLAQVVPGLPDHRAYELVTPPNKGSAADMFSAPELELRTFLNRDFGHPADSGNGFLLETQKAAFGSFPASEASVYVFSRGSGGWTYTSLASPSLGVQELSSPVFDPSGLSRVAFGDGVGSAASETGTRGVQLVGPPGGPYATVVSDAASSEGTSIVGASHDLSHIVLESRNHTLAPEAEGSNAGSVDLYEWAGGGECKPGTLNCKLVNVDSKGSLLNPCGALLGQSLIVGAMHNAVSADGSKVFFTAPNPYAKNDGEGCWNGATEHAPQLYMRVSGTKTVEMSTPEEGVSDPSCPVVDEPACHPAVYVGAAEHGAKVFFATETELTQDAVELELHDPELYEYDTETGKLTRISAGESESPARETGSTGAHVFTVPAVSAEGSAVYFTAFGQLTLNAPAVSGQGVNLYRYDTATGATTYVATVSKRDYPTSSKGDWWGGTLATDVALAPEANWYTTPDGRYLTFASENEFTSYNNAEASSRDCPLMDRGGELPTGHCAEVYRYHYEAKSTGSIVCVSCDPSGAAPTSAAFFGHSAAGLAGTAAGPVRAMSDDGSYVFFDTADALVSTDGNGTLDVYEWHNGRISLISSGHDLAPSFFLGLSAADIGGIHVEAANVFFGAHAKLVRQDTDTAGDLYDARIDGGFAPPPTPGQCEGDACQSPPAAPIDATPMSLTFSGTGNVPGEVKTQITPKTNPTNAQKLAKALNACRKKRKSQRNKCESRARKRYGKRAGKSARARRAMTNRRAGR